ncbi:MAG: septum formation initiator [Flavobacteriales bacterium]|nr:septum formation initiator [Flavobacteriales bacterium]|tara:strand:+ start:10612 stop:10920 length:309 start_codon:yes stop_codon:yes gene_type:complete
MDRIRNVINKIPRPLKNKYILTLMFFTFWIIFIDDYNLIKQHQLQKNVNELENQKEYYTSEISKDSTELYHLQNTKQEQEKFAREKFLMKKDNEDVFIIRDK